jgi:predicted nucleic acid-binding protein
VAALVDTNVLVYRFDARFPEKQRIATEILRRGIAADTVRVAHQAIVEFVAAVTRTTPRGVPILPLSDARREAEEMLAQFVVLYPDEAVVRTAIRGMAAYPLAWFDAHMWAYAEHFGLEEILSEDFQHDRLYGSVRAVNPFLTAQASGGE